jgi:AraC-like DNA-binding protein
MSIAPGRAALLAPKKALRMWWQAGSEQLILKISLDLFKEIDARGSAHATPSLHLLPVHAMPHWEFLIESLLGILAIPGGSGQRASWIDDFERGTVQFLHDQIADAAESTGSAGSAAASLRESTMEGLGGADNMRRLALLEEYILKKLAAPVSVADMAQSIGVSVRWLNVLCRQQRGVAPMVMLRNLRLDAAHELLVASPEVNITETAFGFGFGHLGRFSAYYHDRFGELPRQTISRRCGDANRR